MKRSVAAETQALTAYNHQTELQLGEYRQVILRKRRNGNRFTATHATSCAANRATHRPGVSLTFFTTSRLTHCMARSPMKRVNFLQALESASLE
jgi:hypothetical protein